MKKIFALLMIVAIASACNSKSETTTTATDSATAAESPLMDAVNTADSASKMISDSTAMMMDTLQKK